MRVRNGVAVLTALTVLFLSACGGQPDTDAQRSTRSSARGYTTDAAYTESADGDRKSSFSLAATSVAGDSAAAESSAVGGKTAQGKTTGRSQNEYQVAIQSTGAPKPGDGSLKTKLNSAKLTPTKTGNARLDAKVEAIFSKIFTTGMSTYDKVKACYDYIIKNTSYRMNFISANAVEAFSDYVVYDCDFDRYVIFNAYQVLDTHIGVCDDYAAAFVVMTRAIGIESYVVGGSIKKVNGDTAAHAWVNMKLDGTYYIFDAQADDSSSGNGKINYYFLGKTDAEMGSTYHYDDRAASIRNFGNFKKASSEENNFKVNIAASSGDSSLKSAVQWKPGAKNSVALQDPMRCLEASSVMFNVNVSGGRGPYCYELTALRWHNGSPETYKISGTDYVANKSRSITWKIPKKGDYEFTLVVYDAAGRKAGFTCFCDVTGNSKLTGVTLTAENRPEDAYILFEANAVGGYGEITYEFTVVSGTDKDADLGIASNNLRVLYGKKGMKYTVTVTATDEKGASVSKSMTVTYNL